MHVIGWSLGGIFALLTAADRPDLPIGSLTSVGAPVDVTQVPLVAPIRPFLGIAGERAGLVTQAYRLMGGVPKPLVRRAFQLSSFNKLVTKPIALAAKLDDADFLAQVEAVDRFTANMIAYPGRTFGQLYHRLLKGNQLASGTVTMDDREIRLADITAPLLAFGGAGDGIAPVAVRAADRRPGHRRRRPALRDRPGRSPRHAHRPRGPGAPPGGSSTSGSTRTPRPPPTGPLPAPAGSPPRPARPPPRRRPLAKDRPPRRSRRTGSRPKKAASKSAIGANPSRRYGSAGSRTLAAKKK